MNPLTIDLGERQYLKSHWSREANLQRSPSQPSVNHGTEVGKADFCIQLNREVVYLL
jgi:hypothetical protein